LPALEVAAILEASTMPDVPIHTTGPVLQRLGPVLYRAELPNGKTILAHLSKRLADARITLEPGQRVVMELTPYDFEQARIIDGEGAEPNCFRTGQV
jgi:translation initiation factor IF-1